jgi:hypothetical protein
MSERKRTASKRRARPVISRIVLMCAWTDERRRILPPVTLPGAV